MPGTGSAEFGLPWPGASTPGSSRASSDTDPVAARQFQVAKRGGPPRVCLCDRASPGELRLTVRTASPAMRARSASRNSARWPGVWPDVGMTCQSGRPGTPTSGSTGLSPCCPEGNIQRRSRRAKAPMMRPEGGNGSSPGSTYTVTFHGDVPHAGQFGRRASVVRVHVRQHDRSRAGANPEQGLRRASPTLTDSRTRPGGTRDRAADGRQPELEGDGQRDAPARQRRRRRSSWCSNPAM